MADVEMTIWEHLDELRSRMIKVAIAFVVATLISALFAGKALEILLLPMGGTIPQTIYPTESLVVYFRIALLGGATLSMPVILYQIIRFILPGLMPHERRYLFLLLPGVALCFAIGVTFTALVMLPVAIDFMQGWLGMMIENRWTLDNYISFVTRVLFWMGIVFQTPLLIFLLAKLGLVTPRSLSRFRKYAILVSAIVAAIVTPTPDPLNMMIVMVPLYLLYEVGILLARLAGPAKRDQEGRISTS
ncbi:MAG: twin-arginine translocase subunit TatC [Anaerolineales bacterium]